jgi:hypothetical protein
VRLQLHRLPRRPGLRRHEERPPYLPAALHDHRRLAGKTCIAVVDFSNSMSPRVCLGSTDLRLCPGVPSDTHCDSNLTPPTCVDATTLQSGAVVLGSCGISYTSCPTACTKGDMGPPVCR